VNEALTRAAVIPPADVLITRALAKRPRRASSLQAETAVYTELSRLTNGGAGDSVESLLEAACRLCNAGSAGLSMLRTDELGNSTIRWESIRGALASHEGGETALNSSPCGVCLDAGETVLMWRPERAYRHLSLSLPPIIEKLIAPLYDEAGKPVGTLWVAHHDSKSGFCANDAKILEHLAIQLARNLKVERAVKQHRQVLASLEWHEDAQLKLTRELAEERSRRMLAEASEKSLREALVFKEAATYEAHHRAKNSLQIAASLLSVHARATTAPELKEALTDARARLHVLAQVHELLYRGNTGDREILMSSLLEDVADALRKSFDERSEQIVLTVVSQPISLAPDRAIPLALLANELLTNAYKHAFPDAASGAITLQLSCNPQQELVLQIADDGIGMPEHADHATTLGLRLIRIFAKQLHGELAFAATAGTKGTQITLTAPLQLN